MGSPPALKPRPFATAVKDERAAFPIPALAGRGWSAAVVTERRPEVADPLRAVVIVEMLRFVGLPVSPQWGIRFWNLNGNLNGFASVEIALRLALRFGRSVFLVFIKCLAAIAPCFLANLTNLNALEMVRVRPQASTGVLDLSVPLHLVKQHLGCVAVPALRGGHDLRGRHRPIGFLQHRGNRLPLC